MVVAVAVALVVVAVHLLVQVNAQTLVILDA